MNFIDKVFQWQRKQAAVSEKHTVVCDDLQSGNLSGEIQIKDYYTVRNCVGSFDNEFASQFQ